MDDPQLRTGKVGGHRIQKQYENFTNFFINYESKNTGTLEKKGLFML